MGAGCRIQGAGGKNSDLLPHSYSYSYSYSLFLVPCPLFSILYSIG